MLSLNLGLAYWRSGDNRAACRVLEQLRGELAALGDEFAHAAGLSYLALAQEQSGHAASAPSLCSGPRYFHPIGVQSYAGDACAGQARGALALGDSIRAHEQASHSVEPPAATWAHTAWSLRLGPI